MVFKNGYALVIGVNENLDPELNLDTVAKDVTAVYETLIHPDRCAYDPDNVKLLSGEESTRLNIIEALGWLINKVKADNNATAVLYYSGHGWVDKQANRYYLIPYDIKDRSKLSLYALAAEDFTELISDVTAKRMLAILDCCHSAGMDVKGIDSSGIGELKAIPAAFPLDMGQTKAIPEFKGAPGAKAVSDLLEGEGRAVLNSSTGSEYSWTRADGKMSLFTYHLIEALTGNHTHDESDKVVYVTDVMSWVTRRVKETAAALNVSQTPVMRTSGVFPIAQLIGGKGIAKSAGETPPDPLEHLSSTIFNQTGQNVKNQLNAQTIQGGEIHVGDDNSVKAGGDIFQGDNNVKMGDVGTYNTGTQVNTGGGAYVGGGVNTGGGEFIGRDKNIHGDEVHGDKITGDKVAGDKFTGDKVMGNKTQGDNISVGNISGSTGVAIGGGAKADVKQTTIHQAAGGGSENLARLFAPLQRLVAAESSGDVGLVNELKDLVVRGPDTNDKVIGGLILKLANNVPATKSALIALFQHPAVSDDIGSITKFSLETLED